MPHKAEKQRRRNAKHAKRQKRNAPAAKRREIKRTHSQLQRRPSRSGGRRAARGGSVPEGLATVIGGGGSRTTSAHVAPVAADAAAPVYASQRVRDHAGPANGAPGIAPTCPRPGEVASAETNERRRLEGNPARRSRGRRFGERHGGNRRN